MVWGAVEKGAVDIRKILTEEPSMIIVNFIRIALIRLLAGKMGVALNVRFGHDGVRQKNEQKSLYAANVEITESKP